MRDEIIKKNLAQIEKGYDMVANKFSATRKFFWSDLKFIEKYVSNGDKVLDFGCGNGRLLELLRDKNIVYKGVDISEKLLILARKKFPEYKDSFIKINSSKLRLPFNDKNFNTIYAIASLHHLPGLFYRKKVIREFYRLLSDDGRLVVTVWNLWQSRYRKNIFKNWWSKLVGKSELDWNDCFIPFKDNNSQVFNRYHHAFTGGELRRLFTQEGFLVDEVKKIGGNFVLLARKKSF